MSEIQIQQRDFLRTFFQSLGDTIKDNPMLLGVAVPVVAAGNFLAALSALGFGTSGITTGSLAAAWQSSIGDVAAGSLFATIQSISMRCPGIIISAGTGVAVAAFVLISYIVANELAKNEDIRKVIEDEAHKIFQAIGGFAAHAGGEIHQFVTSPMVQDNVRGAIEFGGRAAIDVKNFGEGTAKGAMQFFGNWMGGPRL